jgi:putative spermidine/putrescine transport system permease protein
MSTSPSPSRRIGGWPLALYSGLVLAFLVLPILVILPLSLTPSAFLTLPEGSLSLRWYHALFESAAWGRAFRNSLAVAAATTIVATPLGTIAALGLASLRGRTRAVLLALVSAPLVVPGIIVAVSLYFLFAPLGLANSFAGLVLAHTLLAVPFVVLAVLAALEGFDFALLRAGASLGAPPHIVVMRILVPLIAPGFGAGMVFAFMTSFDETIAALFLAGPEQRTLPIQMFEGLREQVSPTIAAAASLLVISSSLLLASAEWLRRAASRRYAGQAG